MPTPADNAEGNFKEAECDGIGFGQDTLPSEGSAMRSVITTSHQDLGFPAHWQACLMHSPPFACDYRLVWCHLSLADLREGHEEAKVRIHQAREDLSYV